MLNSPLWWFSELLAAGRHRQCTQTSEVAWFSVCILYYSSDWFIQENGTTVVAVPKHLLSLLLFWTVLQILAFFLQFALAISGAIIGKILLKHSRNRLQASLQNSAPKEHNNRSPLAVTLLPGCWISAHLEVFWARWWWSEQGCSAKFVNSIAVGRLFMVIDVLIAGVLFFQQPFIFMRWFN